MNTLANDAMKGVVNAVMVERIMPAVLSAPIMMRAMPPRNRPTTASPMTSSSSAKGLAGIGGTISISAG